ncbi:hypothetical protein CNMCM5793_001476 [Aspergillus hiratsukae]|uniref:BolA domain protein n=1 Tax=Aspergillus hiratsukae TaxID=1194566 RepID=A0A8H6Q2Q4_9EURO|nr:hypothetical protein CNMCM5793_001476 [Aspergillus hiratsukae]KAF7164662.1 hypothetical protein CNMCM6106_001114 [Aspergillus hiratsukae]
MLPLRSRPGLLSARLFSPLRSTSTVSRMSSTSTTSMEDTIREKITTAFSPSTLIIRNDSHLHAHHAAMKGVASRETHFHVTITSSAFQSKMQAARHRMVYALLKDEMSRDGGIHALQLRTRTPEEEEREKARQSQA